MLADVGDPEHDLFAVRRRKDGDAEVHVDARGRDRNAAVLRQAPFGDVEQPHDLEARDHRRAERGRDDGDVSHDAVDARPDVQVAAARHEMDVGCAELDCAAEESVDLLDCGRVCRFFDDVDRGRSLGGALGRGAVADRAQPCRGIERFDPGADCRGVAHDVVDDRGNHHAQLVREEDVARVGDRDARVAVADGERKCVEPASRLLRQKQRELGTELPFVDQDVAKPELLCERTRDVLLVHRGGLHQVRPEPNAASPSILERPRQLVMVEPALAQQNLAEAFTDDRTDAANAIHREALSADPGTPLSGIRPEAQTAPRPTCAGAAHSGN